MINIERNNNTALNGLKQIEDELSSLNAMISKMRYDPQENASRNPPRFS